MRIALCLSGLMRTFEATFPSLQNHFFNYHKDKEIDTFISTWDRTDRNEFIITAEQKARINYLYNPKSIIIEPFKTFQINPAMRSKNVHHNRDLHGFMSMFYKIYDCNRLKSEYEKEHNFTYDCVIRMRSDIRLEEPFFLDGDLNKINIPFYGDFGGVNDQLAYSNSLNMNIYSNTFNNLDRYVNELIIVDPELYTKENIEINNLSIARFPLEYRLLCHGNVLDNKVRSWCDPHNGRRR